AGVNSLYVDGDGHSSIVEQNRDGVTPAAGGVAKQRAPVRCGDRGGVDRASRRRRDRHAVGGWGATSLWVFSLKDRKAARLDAVESLARTLTGAVFRRTADGWPMPPRRDAHRARSTCNRFRQRVRSTRSPRTPTNGHHPMWSPDGAELLFSMRAGTP